MDNTQNKSLVQNEMVADEELTAAQLEATAGGIDIVALPADSLFKINPIIDIIGSGKLMMQCCIR